MVRPRTTEFGVVTQAVEKHMLPGGQPRPILREGAPASPKFWTLLHARTLYEKK